MVSPADGSALLAQAQPPATQAPATQAGPSNARRRLAFRAGERQIVDLRANETLDLSALPAQLSYRRVPEGLLIIAGDGAEIVLRPAEGQVISGVAVLADGSTLAISDLLANAVQAVAPAAGPVAGRGRRPGRCRSARVKAISPTCSSTR